MSDGYNIQKKVNMSLMQKVMLPYLTQKRGNLTWQFRQLKAFTVLLYVTYSELKSNDSNSLEQKKYAEIGLVNGPKAQRGTNLISATVDFTSKLELKLYWLIICKSTGVFSAK